MTDAELHGCLDFIRQTEKLKDVLRNSYTASGRHESTAEHSWRLALMAMVFGRDLGAVDLLRVLKLCLIHDLGEAIGGDVPAIHQNGGAGKAAQERADLITLLEPLDAARRTEFLALWDEYEAGSTPEARMVKALDKMETTLQKIKDRLGASSAHLEMEFPYFMEKRAPVSGATSLMEYTCRFIGSLSEDFDFILEIRVPVTSLCPCSRELSRFGAHNQRGIITVQVRYRDFVWIEDLVNAIEECGSSQVYSLLKREDEKYVTERAFENPRFVEDMVREAALRLRTMNNVTWFSVSAENFESIHNHSAYASIEMDKRESPVDPGGVDKAVDKRLKCG